MTRQDLVARDSSEQIWGFSTSEVSFGCIEQTADCFAIAEIGLYRHHRSAAGRDRWTTASASWARLLR